MGQSPLLSYQLVFTVAIKQEIPVEWLKEQGVAVHTLKAVKSGALKNRPKNTRNSGILFIITGVGKQHSSEAATWIKQHIKPLYVVNIGSLAALNKSAPVGSWVTPTAIKNEQGDIQQLDTRLPFSLPDNLPRKIGGHLLTVTTPALGNLPKSWLTSSYLDMEAFCQSKIFSDSHTSFHVLKIVSDESNHETVALYQKILFVMRHQLKTILEFIATPTSADITVIIPTYNRERKVCDAIESVLSQSLTPQEIIVVDDGSSDNTSKALQKYADKITLITSGSNLGVSSARNLAIDRCQTTWIALLDSDDTWRCDKLEKQWQFLQANPFYQIMQSQEIWIRNGRRVNPCKHHSKPQGWIWQQSLQRCMISPSSVLLKRKLLQKYDNFDENLPACEDYDLWLRISRFTAVGLEESHSLTRFGGHKDQLSSRYTAMDRFRVTALLKSLKQETEERYQKAIIDVLNRKLTILISGYKKRGNLQMQQKYQNILESIRL